MSEKVEIIDIEVGESSKTIKGLKEEIKNLRTELESCEIGSEKFTQTLDDLTDAQTELKNATKTSNEALEGSYDALTAKMADLKKAWRATADEAERANLGSQIAEINQQLKDMDAEIGNYQRNVGDYGKAFDGVTMKIEGGVAKFEKFNGVARSVIGSFDLVEGALQAIGTESEEVNGIMNTMQGAMKLTAGFQSIKEGVVVFNSLRTSVMAATAAQTGLNAVMLANPIGLIVAAVAALVAGTTALVSIISKNREEEKLLQKVYEDTNRVIADRISSQELEIQLMEARGEAQADILKKEKEYAEYNVEVTKKRIEATEKELEDAGALRFKKKDLLKEQLKDLKEQLKDQEKAVRDANNAILIFNTKTQREQTENERTQAAERYKIAKEETDRKLEEQKRYAQSLKTQYNTLLEELRTYRMTAFEKELDETQNKYQEDLQLLKDNLDNKVITQEEYYDTLKKLQEKYQYEIGMLQADHLESQGLQVTIVPDGEIEKIKETGEAVEETGEKIETLADKIKQFTGATDKQFNAITSGVNLVGTAFGQTSQLLNTLANTQDKTTKEGFETSKKMSIAAATASMLQGVIAAWTSSMALPFPLSLITAGMMTASTIAMGTAQIEQIKKQKFDGGNSSTSSTSVASSMPNINSAAIIASPVNYTTEVAGTRQEEEINQRVYVVESDITDTVNRVKVAEDESVY